LELKPSSFHVQTHLAGTDGWRIAHFLSRSRSET
jgi:hypothetical protein